MKTNDMNDTVSAYIRGRQEGYFTVRLENSILEQNQQSRAFFVKGYQIGKKIREQEAKNEAEIQKKAYIENRDAYITIMGYKAASEGYTADSSLLKDDDKLAFEEGYETGLLHKNNQTGKMNLKNLEIYLMITGYDISQESYLVYLDILKDKNGGSSFQRGHSVNTLCNDIKKSAINELNESQFNMYKKIK